MNDLIIYFSDSENHEYTCAGIGIKGSNSYANNFEINFIYEDDIEHHHEQEELNIEVMTFLRSGYSYI